MTLPTSITLLFDPRTSRAAHWASWADALHVIAARAPDAAESVLLTLLLRGRSAYSRSGASSFASLSDSRLSLPRSLVDAPKVTEFVPAEVSSKLTNFRTHMLRDAADVETSFEYSAVVPYNDLSFRHSPGAYATLSNECS